jgi:hypothetical protein
MGDAGREQWPPCALREQCICTRLGMDEGTPNRCYIAPRFFRPSELRTWREQQQQQHSVAPGFCFLDLLKAWTVRVHHSLMQRHVPAEPINTVAVECGPGEFARDVMLPLEVDGYPTGIEGHVPAFNTARLQYQQVANYSVLRLVHMDFRLSLSQTNVCLGARKLRPLAGTSASTVAVPLALLVAHTVPAAGIAPEWRRFLQSAPRLLLVDRALTSPSSDAAASSRVPAVWLRRFFQEFSFTPQHQAVTPFVTALCFGAYETTVTHLCASDHQAVRDMALAFAQSVEGDPACAPHYAMGSPFAPSGTSTNTNVLWLAARVRIAAGVLAMEAPLVHIPHARRKTLRYMARLFVDTHFGLLGMGADAVRAASGDRLLACYPHALRVVCADELPDLTTALWSTNIWYDSGKKSQRGFIHVLVHILYKLMNQVCQGRSFDTILVSEMQAYPLLASVVALALACGMLGNIPTSQRPLRSLATCSSATRPTTRSRAPRCTGRASRRWSASWRATCATPLCRCCTSARRSTTSGRRSRRAATAGTSTPRRRTSSSRRATTLTLCCAR